MLRRFLAAASLLILTTPIAIAQPRGDGGAPADGAAPPSFGAASPGGGGSAPEAGAPAGAGGAGAAGGSSATPPTAPMPPTEAPGSKSAQPDQVDDARTRMERGQRLFADGKFTEATDEFASAYEKHKFTAFLFNAAVAAERGSECSIRPSAKAGGRRLHAPIR